MRYCYTFCPRCLLFIISLSNIYTVPDYTTLEALYLPTDQHCTPLYNIVRSTDQHCISLYPTVQSYCMPMYPLVQHCTYPLTSSPPTVDYSTGYWPHRMVLLPTVTMFLWVIKMFKKWIKHFFFSKSIFKTIVWICFNTLLLLTRKKISFYCFKFIITCVDLEEFSGEGGVRPIFGVRLSKISGGGLS